MELSESDREEYANWKCYMRDHGGKYILNTRQTPFESPVPTPPGAGVLYYQGLINVEGKDGLQNAGEPKQNNDENHEDHDHQGSLY
jgi:hypothetical protein